MSMFDFDTRLNDAIKEVFGDMNLQIGDLFFSKNKKGEMKVTTTIVKDNESNKIEFKVFDDGSFNIISGDEKMVELATDLLTKVLLPYIAKLANNSENIFNKLFKNIFGEKEKEKLDDFAMIYDSEKDTILFTDMKGTAYEVPRKFTKITDDINSLINNWKNDSLDEYKLIMDTSKLNLIKEETNDDN